ncbi:MAG: phosphoenolpyruvate--protein phosphotransferase [Desulfobacterales bacterium]
MSKKQRDHFSLLCDMGELADLLAGTANIESFLQEAVKLVARHLRAHVCSIYLYEEGSGELVLQATIGLNPKAVGKIRMKPGEGLVGTVFENMLPVREASAGVNPHFKYFEEADEDRFESFLALPIHRGVQKIGVLAVQHELRDYFDENDVMALRAAASQLAGSIENARLLMDLHRISGNIGEYRQIANRVPENLRFIKGQCASKGYAFAPSALFKKSHGSLLSEHTDQSTDYSLTDFREALHKTVDQLKTLQARLAERLPESESLIFSAHFMILKDPKFVDKIAEQIRSGISPPDAVRAVTRHYIDIFSASTHAYIREKASDMEDLGGRILKNMLKGRPDEKVRGKGRIVIARTLYPSEILKLASDDVEGIIVMKGGVTSHVSILARSLQIPMVIADHSALPTLPEGTPLLLDADIGNIHINPDEKVRRQFELRNEAARKAAAVSKKMCTMTHTGDGVRIRLMANVNLLSELKAAKELNAEGIGLYRTEFPFIVRPTFPSEEEQYLVYKRVFEDMGDRDVTIRTLDVSGDKALVYSDATSGANPELGLRSIRFSLHHRNIFEQQIRAILRAGIGAKGLRIMFPLISSVDEFLEARQVVYDCMESLKTDRLGFHPEPAIGMMVEVPSVVEIMQALTRVADFFSIGTNDFIQYTLAVDRTNEKVASYYRPCHPSVLRGLARIVNTVNAAGKEIAVCGEMGHEPEFIPFLLGIGIRTLSVDPLYLPMIQEYISGLNLSDAQKHAEILLAQETVKGAQEVLSRRTWIP